MLGYPHRASPARIAMLARAPLRCVKGAGDHKGRNYGLTMMEV